MEEKEYWLDKKGNAKKLLIGFYVICVCLFLADLIFLTDLADKKAYHQWENWIGFYPVFGFVEFVLLVLLAKHVLRPLMKRKEDYYDD